MERLTPKGPETKRQSVLPSPQTAPLRLPGKWKGIFFRDATKGSQTILKHCLIEHAGNGTNSYETIHLERTSFTIENCHILSTTDHGIDLYYASPTIRGCTIEGCGKSGIALYGSSNPTIEGNSIFNNTQYAVYIATGATNPTFIRNNNLYGHPNYDVYNKSTATNTPATLNWWGSADNPAGRVYGSVVYAPWLGAPATSPFQFTGAAIAPASFSPLGGSATITGEVNADAAWWITMRDNTGATVRAFSGNGAAISQTWDGKDEADNPLPDGYYTCRIDATSDATGQAAAPAMGIVQLQR